MSDGTTLVSIQPGSMLGMEVGNYVIVRALGEGGMGAVYRAIQPRIGAEVAIKILHVSSESQAKRFLLEAQTVNRVRHPNLIKILDTGYLSDQRPYLVMELLDGVPLSDVVGKLGIKLATHVAAEALDALDAVHDVAVVHRDLKPANIFLAREGRVVVLDFGIAKVVDGSPGITRTAALIGTPEYMPPEQIRSQPIDRRADIYAMGVVLYEALAGRRPFAAAATFEMLVQHIERTPTSPRDYVPELPQTLSLATLRALEKAPDDRFQRASEMADALRAAVDTVGATEELAAFVEARAPARDAVPKTPPHDAGDTRDEGPGSSLAPATRDVRSPQPADEDDDPGATVRARNLGQASQDAITPPPPVQASASRRPLFAIAAAVGLAAAALYVATHSTSKPPPPPAQPPAPVTVTSPPAAPITIERDRRATTPQTTEIEPKVKSPKVATPKITGPSPKRSPYSEPPTATTVTAPSADAGTAPPSVSEPGDKSHGNGPRDRKPNPW